MHHTLSKKKTIPRNGMVEKEGGNFFEQENYQSIKGRLA